MRKIEAEMIKAIQRRKNWQKGNTRVESNSDGITNVYLWGNKIGKLNFVTKEVKLSTCGWATRTTVSRLNALTQSFLCEVRFGIKNFNVVAYRQGKVFEPGESPWVFRLVSQ